jgi:hypothetical protein
VAKSKKSSVGRTVMSSPEFIATTTPVWLCSS